MTMPNPFEQYPNVATPPQMGSQVAYPQEPDPMLLQALQESQPPDYDQTIKGILQFIDRIISDTEIGPPVAAQAINHAAQAAAQLAKATDAEGIHTEQTQKTEIMGQMQQLQQQAEQHHLDMMSKIQDMANKQQSHDQKLQENSEKHTLSQGVQASKAQEDLTHQQTMNTINESGAGETPSTQPSAEANNSAE